MLKQKDYLSCAETARLLRAALKPAFPGVKFSVRSDVYSGGASIDVGWTDGPTQHEVRRVSDRYAGGGFDGMIDMAYNVDHWLEPDGTATLAYSPGTVGSAGSIPGDSNPQPSADARMVSFGAHYVFANRSISETFRAVLERRLEAYWGGRERAEQQCRPRYWDQLVWEESSRVSVGPAGELEEVDPYAT